MHRGPHRHDLIVAIVVPVWGRRELTDSFMAHMARLQRQYGLRPIIVGSEESAYMDAVSYKLRYTHASNTFLGRKWNKGVQRARLMGADYVMISGSDDFFSDSYIETWLRLMQEGWDLIGSTDAYFHDAPSGRTKYWPGYTDHRTGHTIGAGRALSARLLDKIAWTPFDWWRSKGLDRSMMRRIGRHPHSAKLVSLARMGIMMVDVKTTENIHRFDQLLGMPMEIDLDVRELRSLRARPPRCC